MEFYKRFLALGLAVLMLCACMGSSILQASANQNEIPIVIDEEILPVLEEAAQTAEEPATAPQEESCSAQTTVAAAALPDSETLYDGYLHNLFYGSSDAVPAGELARNMLNAKGQHLYDYLKSQILLVAAGSLSSTKFTVTYDQIVKWAGSAIYNSTDSSEALRLFMEDFQVLKVIDALLNDCPYELYWYDKVSGVGISYSGVYSGSGIMVQEAPFCFQVVADHRASGYSKQAPAMNTARASAAAKAASNARTMVTQNAGKSDYQKLLAYKNEICALVTYNYNATTSDFSADADPWQLIYVFDGNSATNVVCEGYSKAFQYLCDLSQFSGSVNCYSVVGILEGAGAHMWNIVTIGGKNYLADITNSDGGTVGSDGRLFLAGGSGSIAAGYTVSGEAYTYHSDMPALWGTGTGSILKLSQTGYSANTDPCAGGHTWKNATCLAPKYCAVCGKTEGTIGDHTKVTDKAKAATCTADGLTEGTHCSVCGKVLVAQTKVPALGHSKVIDEAVLPTCGASGLSEGAHCSVCSEILTEQAILPATGEHSYADGICEGCGTPQVLPAPVITGTNVAASGKIKLTWPAVTGAEKYQIWRSASGKAGTFGLISTVKTNSFTATGTAAGKAFYYKVKAVHAGAGQNSDFSNVVFRTCDLPQPKVTGGNNVSTGKITLTWPAIDGAEKYQIWRSASGKTGTFGLISTVKTNSFTATGTAAGKAFYYKVKAIHSNTNASSAYSAQVFRTCDLPRPVVATSINSAGKPQLNWKAISGAEKYQVWYSTTGKTNSFKLLYTTTVNSHVHKLAAAGTTYYYKVKAIHSNTNASSSFSTVVSRTAK